jgi:hypothetical protein
MIWWALFSLSVVLNILFVWYIRNMILRFNFLGENLDNFVTEIQDYQEHLKKIGEMDIYVGDPTIIGLMQHTKDIEEFIVEYQNVFLLEEKEEHEEEKA